MVLHSEAPDQPEHTPSGLSADDDQPVRIPPSARHLLIALLIPLFMSLVSVSVVNVALTPIGESLNADSTGMQWVVAGYALVFGLFLVPAGRIGDATGHRRMFFIGVAVFTIGSTLAGLAPSILTLNAARLIQGIGAGLITPQTSALIQTHFKGKARARAFATLGSTVAIATAVGPLIGGLLIALLGPNMGWRWMFLINLPIGSIGLFLATRWIPNDSLRRAGRTFLDPVGTVILGLAVLAFMFPFLHRSVWEWWLLVPVSLVLIVVFVWWEQRVKRSGRAPMVDVAIFADAAFRNGNLIITIFFLGGTSIWLLTAIFIQAGTGRSALQAALVSLPSALMASVFAQIAGRLVLKLGRKLVIGGLLVMMAGLFGFIALAVPMASGSIPFAVFALPSFLLGAGQGMVVTPNTTLTLNAVDSRNGGVAGGLLALGQRVGSAVGIAIIPGVFFTLLSTSNYPTAYMWAVGVICATFVIAIGFGFLDLKRERAHRAAQSIDTGTSSDQN